jgi:hypothetical protein
MVLVDPVMSGVLLQVDLPLPDPDLPETGHIIQGLHPLLHTDTGAGPMIAAVLDVLRMEEEAQEGPLLGPPEFRPGIREWQVQVVETGEETVPL